MAGNTTNFTITTDLNTSPYYDDYDSDKGFYRILYKPGVAVQARELTQAQTILQKQIDRFAEHVFKEGSLVSGGNFFVDTNLAYVKINDQDPTSNPVTVASFKGTEVTGATTGVKAYVVDTATGTQAAANTKTLFVRYTSSGTDKTTAVFGNGETLTANSGIKAVVLAANATGIGSMFTISEGVIFAKDHFISFGKQSIILDRHSKTPTCRIGFTIQEALTTHTDDGTLLDPAQGAYNFAAPGADRLKLTATLTRLAIDDNAGPPDYVELFLIRNGVVEEKFERSQYSLIRDELARRTEHESGDYFVKGLNLRVREHLDDGTNQGYLTLANGGNSSFLAIGVEPGIAYIKGYDVETLITKYVPVRKGTDFEQINNQIIHARVGSYVAVNELTGAWDVNSGTKVWLYDTKQRRITTKKFSTGAQTGAAIGTAKISGIEHYSGNFGANDAVYLVHLFDIKMTNAAFASVKSIYLNNASTADLGADVIPDTSNNAIVLESYAPLLYGVSDYTRNVRDASGAVDTSFSFRKTFTVEIATDGTFNITSASGEIFPYASGALTSSEKTEVIVGLNATANVALSGTVSTFSNTTVTGSGTTFTNLNVGDKIDITGVTGNPYFITSIANNTSLKVSPAVANTVSGQAFRKVYKIGDILDYRLKGATGSTRTISMTSSTLMEADLKETLTNAVSATVTVTQTKNVARETAKLLRTNRFVKIDCSSAGTTGPFNLGFSDVFKIHSIRKKSGSAFTSHTEGTDVTKNFRLDNGQRDQLYDHASITPNGIALTATDHLLVKLDYFAPDFSLGNGYFSVDSYPIDDTGASNTAIRTYEIPVYRSPITGLVYDLRNGLDFRPVKDRTAADSTTVSGASTNPANTDTFATPSGGLHLPLDRSQITFDYSYYLGRKDVIAMDKTGKIMAIEGNPASVPITPKTPSDVMALGVVTISPFPSLSPYSAGLVNKPEQACRVVKTAWVRHTMRDIGVMKERIRNLEYYASLSLLEKDVYSLQILDPNGLDRFKNGMFVDPFNDHSLGNRVNPDYKIVVDRLEKSIRPRFDMNDVLYDYLSGTNVQQSNNLITLPYTEVEFMKQPYATTTRNFENNVYRYIGLMTMDPDTDVWVDTDIQAENQVNAPTDTQASANSQLETTWDSWQTTVTGYAIYNNTTGELLGTYSTLEEANLWAQYYSGGLHNGFTEALNGSGFTKLKGSGGGGGGNDTLLLANGTIVTQLASEDRIEVRVDEIVYGTRSGTQTVVVGYETITETIDNKIIDVSLIPYIRPQSIEITCNHLKPNTRVWIFVDEEDMSSYLTPTSGFTATGPVSPLAEGASWFTNSTGQAFGLLRLPEGMFRVGTKRIRVSDSPTNSEDTTTYAVGYFVAHGLLQQKTGTIISTQKPIYGQETVVANTVQSVGSSYIVQRDTSSCLGYTFHVKAPKNQVGVFLTSFDIYLFAKHATLGTWFELREVDNSGNITRNTIPYSVVWFDPADMPVSNDASVPFRVYFQSPIFLMNDTEYALILHATDMNPDTYVWISQLGQNDVTTGQRVIDRKQTGNLYDTNNNVDWVPVPNADLKVTFYRANFDNTVTGTAKFGNRFIEKFKMSSVSTGFDHHGEVVQGETRLTLGSITGGTIGTTDYIKGNTSGANAQVVDVSGSIYRVTANTIEDYTTGETVTVHYANGVTKGVTANVTTQTIPTGRLYRYKELSANLIHLELRRANGTFVTGETLVGRASGDYGVIGSFVPLKYSVIDFEPNYLTFANTGITWKAKATSNTSVFDSNFTTINPNNNTKFNQEKIIHGRTLEVSNISGKRSSEVTATLTSNTSYVSPVIDISRTHGVLVHNIVNSNTANETVARNGALDNKYISKTVTLAEGQDAEDIRVLLTAYKPPTTDIHVYARIKHAEDSDLFDDRGWIKMVMNHEDRNSSLSNSNDFLEYEFVFPTSSLQGTANCVVYTNSANVTFEGFKYFAIKVGLSATDSALVPRVADLRAIALQM